MNTTDQIPTAPPVVLSLSGHDPTGGAGIQADIEAIAAQGCHATSVITCTTAQDTHRVHAVMPSDPDSFRAQLRVLHADIPPAAVKIGLIPSLGIAAAIRDYLHDLTTSAGTAASPAIVIDPVLRSGGGDPLVTDALRRYLTAELLPLASLCTPNRHEARQLADTDDLDAAAARLLEHGCGAVLITGADEASGNLLSNRLHRPGDAPRDHFWPRFDGSFHGSGCTLAAACAARLALGEPLPKAVQRAQSYAWQTIGAALPVGSGQWLPRRLPQ